MALAGRIHGALNCFSSRYNGITPVFQRPGREFPSPMTASSATRPQFCQILGQTQPDSSAQRHHLRPSGGSTRENGLTELHQEVVTVSRAVHDGRERAGDAEEYRSSTSRVCV